MCVVSNERGCEESALKARQPTAYFLGGKTGENRDSIYFEENRDSIGENRDRKTGTENRDSIYFYLRQENRDSIYFYLRKTGTEGKQAEGKQGQYLFLFNIYASLKDATRQIASFGVKLRVFIKDRGDEKPGQL